MSHQHDRLPQAFTQIEEQAVHLLLVAGIEVARRFVGQQHGGRIHQRPGNGDPLLLAARQLAGLMIAALGQPHERQQLSGTPLHFGFRTPSDQARDTDILESRKFGQQVVELENESDLLVTEPRQSPITER